MRFSSLLNSAPFLLPFHFSFFLAACHTTLKRWKERGKKILGRGKGMRDTKKEQANKEADKELVVKLL